MNSIRFGIAGLGNMGRIHAWSLLEGKIPRAMLAAVADPEADLTAYKGARTFTSSEAMIASGEIDALLIATPHDAHVPIGIAALKQGLHVLVEKPIAVDKASAQRLLAAHTNPAQVFAAMFNQRTDPHYAKVRELIQTGELGEIRRVHWTITNWFRTEAYYNSGGWRATWSGEGGGVLLNQSPHNLDLFQWLFGMPAQVRAHCQFGRYHSIEVEDDVTAYFQYANGATASFITSTGEYPGTNRLEIAADRGRVVVEDGRISWTRTEVPVNAYSHTTPERYAGPPTWQIEIPVQGNGAQHIGILKNFVEAILDHQPLLAPAEEGIHSVELANAMLLSSFLDRTIALPLDAVEYAAELQKKIAHSQGREKLTRIPQSIPLTDASGSSLHIHPSYNQP